MRSSCWELTQQDVVTHPLWCYCRCHCCQSAVTTAMPGLPDAEVKATPAAFSILRSAPMRNPSSGSHSTTFVRSPHVIAGNRSAGDSSCVHVSCLDRHASLPIWTRPTCFLPCQLSLPSRPFLKCGKQSSPIAVSAGIHALCCWCLAKHDASCYASAVNAAQL